jgi:hypothetical protein
VRLHVFNGISFFESRQFVKRKIQHWLARLPIPIEANRLAASVDLTFLWAIASLWFPFRWDHGIMASVGDTIVRGGMPYRDAWDMKGHPQAYP